MKKEEFTYTVGMLKKILQGLSDDMPVYVKGYEGGVQDVKLSVDMVLKNVNTQGYYGPHEVVHPGSPDTARVDLITAFIIR